jgi:two-component system, LytTR family, response regulator
MEDSLLISTHGDLQVVKLSDILYCKSDRSYCSIFLHSQESVLITDNLKSISELFDPYFLRVSRSVIVHCRYIQRVDKKSKTIHLSNGASLNFTIKYSDIEIHLRNLLAVNAKKHRS